MSRLLKLKKPLTIHKEICIPIGSIMSEDNWIKLIGRKGIIDLNTGSDIDWWQEINIDDTLKDELIKHLEFIHNYIRGCYNDEKDELQRKEDLQLMYNSEHLKNSI